MDTIVKKKQNMDYIDDKVHKEYGISEGGKGKSSYQENMKNDFLNTETRNNSKSVHDEVQLGNRDFFKDKNGFNLVNTSSSTKTNFTENHGGGIQKKSLALHSNGNASRMADQVSVELFYMI